MSAVVGLCHKTFDPETVCVMYGKGQSHCQSTSQNEKVMAKAVSVKTSLNFQDCTLSTPRHSIISVALTMCPRLHDAKTAKQTKTANAASSELGPPSSYTTAEGFTNPPSWTVPGTDACNNGNPHARCDTSKPSRGCSGARSIQCKRVIQAIGFD